MNKIKKSHFIYSWKFYFAHFLTQLDSSLLIFGIPIFATNCIKDPLKSADGFFMALGIIPLSAMIKLVGGIFFAFFLSNYSSKKIFYFSLTSMGIFACFFGMSQFIPTSNHFHMTLGVISFCLFKFFIASEKASSFYMILSTENKASSSIFFYQLSSLLACFFTGWLFYSIAIDKIINHLTIVYFALGALFMLIAYKRKEAEKEEVIIKQSFKTFTKKVIEKRNFIFFLSILFGIDQITYLFSMNLSPIIYQINHPNECLHFLNLLMLIVDLAMLPILTMLSKKMLAIQGLMINLIIQVFFFPLTLLILPKCAFSTLIVLRSLSIIIGLFYSISLMNFLKYSLDQSLLFLIFISKSIGALLIMTPSMGLMMNHFIHQKNLLLSLSILPLLSLVGIWALNRLTNTTRDVRFLFNFK